MRIFYCPERAGQVRKMEEAARGSDAGAEMTEESLSERVANDTIETQQDRRRLRMLLTRWLIVIFSILFALALGVGCAAAFFKVRTITVEGAGQYDAGLLAEASGIHAGDGLYALDKAAIRTSIMEAYPYIDSVRIIRQLPSGVLIRVTEELPAYYFELEGELFVLSEELRVLERSDDRTALLHRYPNLIEIRTLPVSSAIVGRTLRFTGKTANVYAKDMLKLFLDGELGDRITMVDFSSRFDIRVVVDDRLTIEVGDAENLEMKIRFAMEIMQKINERYEATINVENEEAYVIITRSY